MRCNGPCGLRGIHIAQERPRNQLYRAMSRQTEPKPWAPRQQAPSRQYYEQAHLLAEACIEKTTPQRMTQANRCAAGPTAESLRPAKEVRPGQ